jgi:uracil-DNA glycosylase family 4
MANKDPRGHCDPNCPRLHEQIASPRMCGRGVRNAKILVVGEAPGQNEDRRGEPFVGESGKLLRDALDKVGISWNDMYITNAVKCATANVNQSPNKKTIKYCRKYLEKEIEKIDPNVIAVFGAIPLDAVLRRSGITKLKNNILHSDEFGVKVIPIFHPAYILRNIGLLDDFIKGVALLKQEAESSAKVQKASVEFTHWDQTSDIDGLLDKLETCDKIVFDLETSHLEFTKAKILCIAISWAAGIGVTVKWDGFSKEQLQRFACILNDKNKLKINQNIKFDLEMLKASGIDVQGPFADTLLEISLIDENMKEKGLDALVLQYLDIGEYWKKLDDEKLRICKEKKIKKKEFNYAMFKYDDLAEYAQWDADATFRIHEIFDKKLTELDLQSYYKEHSIPTMELLVELEYKGVLVDRPKLKDLIIEYKNKLEKAHTKIRRLSDVQKYERMRKKRASNKISEKYFSSDNLQRRHATVEAYIDKMVKEKDWVFNQRSVPQLAEILFDRLHLEPIKKSKKTQKPSTDKETLDIYAKQGIKLCGRILEYRGLAKYIATYLVSTYQKSKVDSRIHANYLQAKARTGRLACTSPNMQNIPRKSKDYKECIVADPGYLFVKGDLKQAEFRCWANYSNDPAMLRDIASGMDIHRATASEVFQIPMEEITKEQREVAKACVAGDTWIPTPTGFVRINTLKTGDFVLDQYNKAQKILETIDRTDDAFVVRTECGTITCTKDHPFIVINKRGQIVTRQLIELNPEDYILSATPKNLKKECIRWKYTGPKLTCFKPIFDEWLLNPKMAYLIGFIMAEGSIQLKKNRTSVTIGWFQKGKLVPGIDKLSKQIFGDRVRRFEDKRTGVTKWLLSSVEFLGFLNFIGLKYLGEKGMKSFPEKIMMSPPKVQKAFLRGYFAGDGTFKKSGHKASVGSVSKDIADSVGLLLRSFGIYPKVYTEYPKGGQEFYNVTVCNLEELDILANEIGVRIPNGWEYPKQDRGRKFLHNTKKFYFENHPVGDVRYHIKLRKKMMLKFLRENCLGVNKQLDMLIKHNIYSVKIKSIMPVGKKKVYDFVTTGDKIMVANGFVTLDCTFGPMYGRGAHAIAEEHKISIKQAEHIRSVLFKKYPVAAQWLQDQVAFVHEHGYVKTWLGRYRRLPDIYSDEPKIVAKAEREAMNSPIQGLASNMNDHYMYTTNKLAKKNDIDCYPVVTQHDAQIFLVKEGQEGKLIKLMERVVQKAFPEFKAKMALDFEVGKTLGTLESIK